MKLLMGFLSLKVKVYVSPPTRCFRCLSFGHVAAHCRDAKDKCSACSGDQKRMDCPNQQTKKCANCKGDHDTFDTLCPAYAEAKKAAAKGVETGKSYAQALKQVRKAETKPANAAGLAKAQQQTPVGPRPSKAPAARPLPLAAASTATSSVLPKADAPGSTGRRNRPKKSEKEELQI